MKVLIKQAKIIDSSSEFNGEKKDVLIINGKITEISNEIKPTDKNLGPAVMDTSEYVNQVLTEHLLTKHYKQLTQTEATNRRAVRCQAGSATSPY